MSLPSANKNCNGRLRADGYVLDHKRIATVESLIGSERSAIAFRKFKRDLETRIAAIAANTTAPPEKSEHAHKIVGIAGTIGFQELSDESRRLEQAINQNSEDLHPYIASLISAAQRANAALEVLFG